jgi:hypothetical protein
MFLPLVGRQWTIGSVSRLVGYLVEERLVGNWYLMKGYQLLTDNERK